MSIDAAAQLLRLLGNSARLRIVLRIGEQDASVAELESELKIRQPNLSQHLADLRDAGLLVSRRTGRSVIYSLAGAKSQTIVECLAKTIGHASPKRHDWAVDRYPDGDIHRLGAAAFARISE
jgi:DNA-binding transcriptional ArsR family regulator